MNTIGEVFKERRSAKGLSVRAVAKMAGVSHTEVFRIETGERANPSLKSTKAIGDVLGIPSEEILRLAGYESDGGIPLIEKLFPDLKTEKQQWTIRRVADALIRNPDLENRDYDDLTNQVEMFLDFIRKKRNIPNV